MSAVRIYLGFFLFWLIVLSAVSGPLLTVYPRWVFWTLYLLVGLAALTAGCVMVKQWVAKRRKG